MCLGMANGGKSPKMTDKEIIKALECCFNNEENCDNCPQHSRTCIDDLLKSSLDLIKQQQAEIEKLNVELVGMRGACNSYKMHYDNAKIEIEKQRAEIQTLREDIHNRKARENRLRSKIKGFKTEIERLKKGWKADVVETENIKAETIKDLEAKIYEKLHEAEMHGNFEPTLTREMLDSILKEMVGEGK